MYWTCSSSPITSVLYNPIRRIRHWSKPVMEILSRSMKGLVRKSIAPPTKFDNKSFVANPSAKPPTPAKEKIDCNDKPVAKATPSAHTTNIIIHKTMPDERRAKALHQQQQKTNKYEI